MSYASISHCYQTSRGIASAEHTVYLASNAFVYAFVTHLNLVCSFFSYFFKWFASYLEKDEFSNRFYFLKKAVTEIPNRASDPEHGFK